MIGQYAILATLLLVAALVISFVIALTILIRMPPDCFLATRAQGLQDAGHGIFVRIGIVLKNLLGAILIVIGVILSIPGLPGQGLLTVLAGIFLLDFPGKRSLLYKILSRPLVLQPVNWLRAKFSRPPLVVG